jgi:hyperosmotically inducible protein
MALLTHQSTSAFMTRVKTSDGVVTLSGNTRTAAEREMVSKVANNANGVIKVINNMTIDETLSKI